MPYPAEYQQIEDFFIGLSNETGSLISNLKLQKLMYYAQAWHLGVFGDEMFDKDFQAWVHGPVIPELYQKYRDFGWKPIVRDDLNGKTVEQTKDALPKDTWDLLWDVVKDYFGEDAFALEQQTHNELPWQSARGGLAPDEPSNAVISRDSMREFYSQFVG